MGQAWCKEKSTKAQDSKSPLDRVFLRCAHRIYPGLKEEGSVLGGATQRVTSSEIGYASSPPRGVLTRGQSIDSVDRPFHPSDWVDVNLEVPVTPRTTPTMTNFTLDTTIYPPTNLASNNSSGGNLRDSIPIPPPRRRKKNRGRPLPPKPDEIEKRHVDRLMKKSSNDSRSEHLYSSVKLTKNLSSDKEIFQHQINGTGRIIPSTVVAAGRTNREKSSRVNNEKNIERKNCRPKNSSTVSLPNYSELEKVNDILSNDEDDEEIKIHKITAAGSLPVLITSGVLENLKKISNDKQEKNLIETKNENEEEKSPIDEVDFSFDVDKNKDSQNSIFKLEKPKLTSTPIKNSFDKDSKSSATTGGWFLHQDTSSKELENNSSSRKSENDQSAKSLFYDCRRDSRSDIFFEAEEDQLNRNKNNCESEENNDKREDGKTRMRMSLKRSLSNESEPFDICEEKELRERDSTILRSNSEEKLHGRTISEESLPREMLENEGDFFEEKKTIRSEERIVKMMEKKESMEKNNTKTPPPSPEPKIKPEILDNDHSVLLKVLAEETEDSNLSSMTPSLTELEAALSDMLEREGEENIKEEICELKNSDENLRVENFLENPIEPKILTMDKDLKIVDAPISLKNILDEEKKISGHENSMENSRDDFPMVEIRLTSEDKFGDEKIKENESNGISHEESLANFCPTGEPPEKPSRLCHTSQEEPLKNLGNVPTPPRRRNRFSGSPPNKVAEKIFLERTSSPENSYSNDRLI